MNKLAYIGKIIDIQPIKKADFIVSATVICGEGGKWNGTVKKGAFNVGDMVEVYLQDALLPETDEFEFMKPYHYRISMKRFKKVPSECLIMPMSLNMTKYGLVGTNIASAKGVMKYEKPIAACLSGVALGAFPTSIIPKTDEPNFQTVGDMVEALRGEPYYSTIKADGSSGTVYKHDEHFGVCSRNLELKPNDNNAFWQMAQKYEMLYRIPKDYGIQFELIGPGIQENRMGLSELDIRVFNVWDIYNRTYLNAVDFENFCEDAKLPTVQGITWNEVFHFETDEQLRKYAESWDKDMGHPVEGLVIRPIENMEVNGERLSFKVLNLNYKD